MLRYLGAKFWMRMACLALIAIVLIKGPKLFHGTAQELTFSDSVQTEEAAPVAYSPVSGLTYEVELELQKYIEQLSSSPAAHDWKFLHEEWFALSRQWFERLFADPAHYNRYVQLWLAKRRDAHEWRIGCRLEFFPDMSDRELFDKIDWLRQQDEWTEMQTKIQSGLDRIERDYQAQLVELLGDQKILMNKLQEVFLRDNLPGEGNNSFFI